MVKHCIAFAFTPAVKQEIAGTMARETASKKHTNNQKLYNQYFKADCFTKPLGQTKFVFTVNRPKRKKPTERATINISKNAAVESPHSVVDDESINIENTDFQSGSNSGETENLDGDVFSSGAENWEHRLKLKDKEISCLLQQLQAKKGS